MEFRKARADERADRPRLPARPCLAARRSASGRLGQRVAFANDPEELLAVNGGLNQAKGDSGPDSWLPPDHSYRCTYVIRFTRVAYTYGLRITPSMRDGDQPPAGHLPAGRRGTHRPPAACRPSSWPRADVLPGGRMTAMDESTPQALAPSASQTVLSRVMTVTDTNLLGSVHGGVVMKLVDDVAGLVANRHSGGPAVTVALDEMAFLVPVRVGDLLQAEARVNWAGRTSMELGVRVFAERWDQIGPRHRVATAYLVFVAVDATGEPRAVPQLVLETDEDGRRFREAEIRRTHRLARRDAIQASRRP